MQTVTLMSKLLLARMADPRHSSPYPPHGQPPHFHPRRASLLLVGQATARLNQRIRKLVSIIPQIGKRPFPLAIGSRVLRVHTQMKLRAGGTIQATLFMCSILALSQCWHCGKTPVSNNAYGRNGLDWKRAVACECFVSNIGPFFKTTNSFLDEISRITALRYFPSDRRSIGCFKTCHS